MGLKERREKEKEQRKNTILRAARKLFFEKGFRSVTVEGIAKRADLAKGSIYLYFRSKEEIYTQILLRDIDSFHRKVSNLLQTGDAASAVFHKFCDIYIDFFLNDRELFRILMTFMLHTEHMNLPEDTHEHIIKMTNRTVNVVEEILQYGIDRGEFSALVNVRQMRNAIWGLLNGIIALHLFTGPAGRREETIRSTMSESVNVLIAGMKGRA